MKTSVRGVCGLTVTVVISLVGCGSSQKAARTQGLAELQQMQSAVRDMNIVVSAGVTKDEYSKRLTDALLKFGDPTETCKRAIAKFPKGEQQSAATEACQHLSSAMDAYTYAKEYTGLSHDPDFPDVLSDELGEKEYSEAKMRFSGLEELPVAETNPAGYKFYRRSATVQALWKTATQESEAAGGAFERLSQI